MDTVIFPTMPTNVFSDSIIDAEGVAEIPEPTVPQTRPWVRYFARTIDVFLFSLLAGFMIGVFAPSILEVPTAFLNLGILFVWIFQEAILMANCGTTPGKWLFRIKVRNSKGQKLTFSEALNRSFGVWLKGMGAGVPLISLLALLSSRSKLKRDGITAWDEEGGFVVTHGTIGFLRPAVVVLLLIGFAYLNALGSAMDKQEEYGIVSNSIESYSSYARPIQNATTEPEQGTSATVIEENEHDINKADFNRAIELGEKWLENQPAFE